MVGGVGECQSVHDSSGAVVGSDGMDRGGSRVLCGSNFIEMSMSPRESVVIFD